MKSFSKLAWLVGLVLCTASCADYLDIDIDDIDDITGDENNSELVGTWDITSMKASTFQSMVLKEETEELDMGTLTFNSSGSGTYSITSAETDVTESGDFDWFTNDDKVIMNVLTLSDSVSSDNLALAWEVMSGGSTSQEWMADFTYYSELEEDPNGNPVEPTEYLMRYEMRVFIKKQ